MGAKVQAGAGVEATTRRAGNFLYVIAARRNATTSQVRITGLPSKIRGGQVLFDYVQDPPPPPIDPTKQKVRSVAVSGGAFRDWFGPHDVHVYRFATR